MLDPLASQPRFTYGDYQLWSGEERWELIDGEPFDMSPSPSRRHQEVVVALLTQIASALRDTPCRVYVAPFDVRLPRHGEADAEVATVVQPDLAVVCDPDKLDERGCRGAPDWIIEVLSPATAARDRFKKRDLYQAHGVAEYWIVDPEEATLRRHRLDPRSGRYDDPDPVAPTGRMHPAKLPAVEIDWQSVFA